MLSSARRKLVNGDAPRCYRPTNDHRLRSDDSPRLHRRHREAHYTTAPEPNAVRCNSAHCSEAGWARYIAARCMAVARADCISALPAAALHKTAHWTAARCSASRDSQIAASHSAQPETAADACSAGSRFGFPARNWLRSAYFLAARRSCSEPARRNVAIPNSQPRVLRTDSSPAPALPRRFAERPPSVVPAQPVDAQRTAYSPRSGSA